MNPPVWRVEDDGEVQFPVSARAEAGLVSLPFLVAAVRRRWRRVAATIGVCVFLALGLTQVMGGQSSATVTLLVISDPSADSNAAMTNNLSLLHTRKLAQQVITELGLPLTPEDFLATVTGGELSDQLMTISVAAPSEQDAIDRVTKLADDYLVFRGQQLSAFADSAIQTNKDRIAAYTAQIKELTKRYDVLASAPGQEQVASEVLSQRTDLESAVSTAQQENAQTELQNEAIIDASHVVDPAAIVHKSRLKGAVLALVSGVIGGTALGLALVLAPAILSTRLRRRDDVARALGLPVRFSAGRVRSRWWWLPGRQDRRNAQRLAHGLAIALPDSGDTARLTLATIGDVRDGAFVVGALADELARESTRVAVVDLSSSGALAAPSRFQLGRRDPIRNRQLVRVHRHDVRVSRLGPRARIGGSSDNDLGKAEVILTLIELDLGAGVDALGDLADTSVVLVSTGRPSAERLRSSAMLLRQSDIRPSFAMLVGADDTDDSSGLLENAGHGQLATRRSS
jgi:capsular polysaccharide biosynthesis protein